jgi:antirestriction protein ArdC
MAGLETTSPPAGVGSYVANWLEVLKNDARFIFKATAHVSGKLSATRLMDVDDLDSI